MSGFDRLCGGLKEFVVPLEALQKHVDLETFPRGGEGGPLAVDEGLGAAQEYGDGTVKARRAQTGILHCGLPRGIAKLNPKGW